MSTGTHGDQGPAQGIHVIQAFEVADAAALAALSVVVADIGKVARKLDDSTYHVLSSVGPSVWTSITISGGSGSVFGQDYQTVVSLARSTTGSNTFQTKLVLTTPSITGTYRISWCAVVDQSNVSDAVQVKLENTTDASTFGATQEHEPKDNRNRIHVGGFGEQIFAGAAKTFEIQYRQQRGNTAGIQDARIEIWRVA